MGTVHIEINENLLQKLKKISELRGFNNINEFIIHTIENEISSQEIIPPLEVEEFKIDENDSAIIHQFTNLASRLKKISDPNERVELLLSVDSFIKEHEMFLKDIYPELLVNILNSL